MTLNDFLETCPRLSRPRLKFLLQVEVRYYMFRLVAAHILQSSRVHFYALVSAVPF